MSHQLTFADCEFNGKRRQTRKEIFLSRMEQLLPWPPLDQPVPDRTTIMNFRHLLEQHQLARQLFESINLWLSETGIIMTQRTLVDATIIPAPSLTKNKQQQQDLEMHQTKKGNQWHFGMKTHIGGRYQEWAGSQLGHHARQ